MPALVQASVDQTNRLKSLSHLRMEHKHWAKLSYYVLQVFSHPDEVLRPGKLVEFERIFEREDSLFSSTL